MAYLTQYLDTIRGYRVIEDVSGNELRYYDHLYYPFNTVRDAIVTVLSTIGGSLFPDVDIDSELATINSATIGPDIRNAIYSATKKLLIAAGKTELINLTIIQNAHYGVDMRESLYDIFKKLGAEDSRIGHLFCTADEKGFYTDDENLFCVKRLS